jgi:hypothetical protein
VLAVFGRRRQPFGRGDTPKRCIDGVDLNPMAVELAKVSLMTAEEFRSSLVFFS